VRGRRFQSPFEVGHDAQPDTLSAEIFGGGLDHLAEAFDFLIHADLEKKI
jgi:hypothetical protein